MKKILPLLLAMLLLLAACGGNADPTAAPTDPPAANTPEPTPEAPVATDPPAAAEGFTAADAKTLMDAGLFNEGLEALDDFTMIYPDIDPNTVVESICYIATNTSVSADELTILVFQDEASAQAAEAVFEARVAAQIETSKDYTPAAVPRLESAVIRVAGNSAILAVGDPDNLEAAVDNLLG